MRTAPYSGTPKLAIAISYVPWMLDGAFTRNVAFSTLNPASAVGSAAEATRKKIAKRTTPGATRRVRGVRVVVAAGGGDDDDVLGDAAREARYRRGAISRSRANAKKRDAGRRARRGRE